MPRCVQSFGKTKIFCIGQNKTGTTSFAQSLKDLGIYVAPTFRDHDPMLEKVINDWSQGDYKRIKRFCRYAQGFQDYPFSLPNTYKALDSAFPGSKFVLTIRDSAEQWCDSYVRYYLNKYWGGNAEQIYEASTQFHPYSQSALHRMRLVYGDWEDPFDRIKLIESYKFQNDSIKSYFQDRPEDLLVINVSNNEDYFKLCEFVGMTPASDSFPWLNKVRAP